MSAPGCVGRAWGQGEEPRAQSCSQPPTQNSLCVPGGEDQLVPPCPGDVAWPGQEAGGPEPGGKSRCLWSACLRVGDSKVLSPLSERGLQGEEPSAPGVWVAGGPPEG